VGLFVQAEIVGREIEGVVVLPRAALHGEGRVLVVDGEDRLHFREVDVLRLEREHVVIGDGLAAGERVCVSPLPAAVDGMAVRVADEAPGLAKADP
jgi:multidrug efflux pump subunit AcrA (membrane-fusion protein)